MQNVDAILAAKPVELAMVGGVAESVVSANVMAWNALEGVLGTDPVEAWSLKGMTHTVAQLESGKMATQFQAEFVRRPDEEE